MENNFVSISGVSDGQQLKGIYKICQEEKIDFPIMIGYQVSNKSINQRTQNQRQPKFTDLVNLSKETLDYNFIPAVHYYTKNNETIIGDLEKIVEIGINPSLTLIQFNTLPPHKEVLRKIKEKGFRIIFKVAVSDKQSSQGGYAVWKGEEVQDVETGKIESLVEQIQRRKDVIDYAMFDPSHGTNLNLNLEESSLAVRFGKEILRKEHTNKLGLIYAGGIKPANVIAITRSLLSFFPQEKISIDIESGVRNNENELNLNLVRNYLLNYRLAIFK